MIGRTTDALARRASELLWTGPVADAIEAHEALLEARPDLAEAWYNLGFLQRCARLFPEALRSYERAIERGIGSPEEAHVNRSVILGEHLGREDEAAAELRIALSLNPRHVPALLNLGVHHEDCGDAANARVAYERVLAIDPWNARALARLSVLASADGSIGSHVSRLRAGMARSGISRDERAELGFALGQVLDAAGSYDEAFRAFAAANEASRSSALPQAAHYDRVSHEQFVQGLIDAFPAAPHGDCDDAVASPIFICGLYRSGSTLTEQILGSHSQVTAGGELELLPALVRQRIRPYPSAIGQLGSADIRRLRDEYLTQIRTIHPDAAHITDKRPDNFLHIGFIKALFPAARIVHTMRDPRDTALSIWFQNLQHSVNYGTNLDDISHWIHQYYRIMRYWKALFGDDILDLRYEELVAQPRSVVERLLSFCRLDWEDSCLSFHENRAKVKTASVWQVRRPIYRDSVGRWRNYEDHIADLSDALLQIPEAELRVVQSAQQAGGPS